MYATSFKLHEHACMYFYLPTRDDTSAEQYVGWTERPGRHWQLPITYSLSTTCATNKLPSIVICKKQILCVEEYVNCWLSKASSNKKDMVYLLFILLFSGHRVITTWSDWHPTATHQTQVSQTQRSHAAQNSSEKSLIEIAQKQHRTLLCTYVTSWACHAYTRSFCNVLAISS